MRTPVRIRGVVYRDTDHAARVLNVSRGAVHAGLSRGRPDQIGLGIGGGRTVPTDNGLAKRVRIGRFTWPSIAAAARDLKCSRKHVRNVLASGCPERLARMLMERDRG